MEQVTLAAVREHAAAEYPRECCGLVIIERGAERYVPCRNVAVGADGHFVLPAEDYAAAEERGEVVRVVHSHPDQAALPSDADKVSCEISGLPWTIISWPAGDLHTFAPCGYQAPLVGRMFAHGVLDCYALIRDWFRVTHRIELPDFPRHDDWWNDGQSDFYREHFREAGFVAMPEGTALAPGDVIPMQIRSRNGVPNHAAVYLGDGLMLHHLHGRLSSRDVYGGYWREVTRGLWRHHRLIDK